VSLLSVLVQKLEEMNALHSAALKREKERMLADEGERERARKVVSGTLMLAYSITCAFFACTPILLSPLFFIASHLISSHLISFHLISSHLISSHLISSHLISSHRSFL
jgi:hypothetical protein